LQKTILITVDLEDWFQVENLRSCFPHEKWEKSLLRIEASTRNLLALFKKHHVKATFFALGWIAKHCPEIIKEISENGHEIASHGFNHELCNTLSRAKLSQDIQRGKELLESITNQQIFGYRAPNFSVTEELISILKDHGFIYDSSFNDFSAHERYGSLPGEWTVEKPGLLKGYNGLYEMPVRNLNLWGRTMPWGGGGYFRLIPVRIFNMGVEKILNSDHTYLFYCHPWEFDPDQPRIRSLRRDYRFRHYVNIGSNLSKMDRFLHHFSGCRFMSCHEYITE